MQEARFSGGTTNTHISATHPLSANQLLGGAPRCSCLLDVKRRLVLPLVDPRGVLTSGRQPPSHSPRIASTAALRRLSLCVGSWRCLRVRGLWLWLWLWLWLLRVHLHRRRHLAIRQPHAAAPHAPDAQPRPPGRALARLPRGAMGGPRRRDGRVGRRAQVPDLPWYGENKAGPHSGSASGQQPQWQRARPRAAPGFGRPRPVRCHPLPGAWSPGW